MQGQKWEYARLWIDRVDFWPVTLSFFTTDGVRTEKPPEEKEILEKGKTRRERISKDDVQAWFYKKIAALGQDGWELVTAPNGDITTSNAGSDVHTRNWQLWFKRPVRDSESA